MQTWLQKRRRKEKKKEKEKLFRTVIVCALEAFEAKQHEVIRRKHHKLKMMPNQNSPVFPNRRRLAGSLSRHHPNHWVLVSFPRTYFEVEDIRPGEDELPEYTFGIFKTTNGGLTIPKELNRKILQYLPGKDLLKFSKASNRALWNVEFSHALMFDAIHE